MPRASQALTSRQARAGPWERFAAINRERLRRTRDCLPAHQRVFLDVVPLLFHSNHPLLPGYVSQDTPFGVADYAPSRASAIAARQMAKSFTFDRHQLRHFAIEGLYLMGSPGTIAYSRTSDFDIWLCHAANLTLPALVLLQRKASGVEAWAAELGLEVHFFLLQAERFKHGETLGLSSESSGSSQYHLLLDEFYRSGLVLAGMQPLWWRVPPEEEHRYDDYVDDLHTKRLINRKHFIDFGGLYRIPADEFLGAAIWQLSKSIGSPYKSVQKLLLMESYAQEYPTINLLSKRYKQAVYAGVSDLNELDPYVLMYRKTEEYLRQHGDRARIEVLRRSFYLKTGVKLSRPAATRDPEWRRSILDNLVSTWAWNRQQLLHLDNQEAWNIDAVLTERHDLTKALTRCYTRLSEFAREYAANARITQTDLNVLGRKLYAAFERKPGKVELVNHGITPDLLEPQLSLQCVANGDNGNHWVLYRGIVGADATSGLVPLRRADTVVALAAWCHFNRLSGTATFWHLFPGDNQLTKAELGAILRFLELHFPQASTPAASADALSKAPRVTKAILVTNVGIDPMRARIRDGRLLTSSANDAFQFSGQRINLAQTFDLILTTSWQEIFCFSYTGMMGLVQAVSEYLRWSPFQEQAPPPALDVGCFASQYAPLISRRVQALFDAVRASFYDGSGADTRHYIIEVENCYYRVSARGGKPHTARHETYTSLLAELGQANTSFCQVEFDPDSLRNSPLPAIYSINRPDLVQVFIDVHERKANIYILDEMGSLFTQTHECHALDLTYSHIAKFFAATLKHVELSNGDEARAATGWLAVEYFQLHRNKAQRYEIARLAVPPLNTDYLQVKVLGDIDAAGTRHYTVYCDAVEFSTARHGNRVLDAAANHIRRLRSTAGDYPVYITDIDLSGALLDVLGITRLQSSHLLNQKKRLEYRLTRAIHSHADAGGCERTSE